MNQAAAISWADYYRETAGRAPRDLFTRALGFLGETASRDRLAIDLGCGDGTEVLALLDAGWRVLAIDQEDAALALLASRVPPDAANRLQVQAARFETVAFPPADLVYAGLSLFFCPPSAFRRSGRGFGRRSDRVADSPGTSWVCVTHGRSIQWFRAIPPTRWRRCLPDSPLTHLRNSNMTVDR